MSDTSATAAKVSGSSASEVHSDFNGDGYEDLVVGISQEDIGTKTDAGAVQVLYGSPSGIQGTSPSDQFWHEDSPGVSDAAESGNLFGGRLAAADFNGDGKSDLAISAPQEAGGRGAVHVLYGSSSGLQATSPAAQFWTQDSPGIDDTGEVSDFFGYSLAAGDFDHDGYDDLAIGVVGEDLGTKDSAGAVHVLFGSSSGLQSSSPGAQFWTQDSTGIEDAVESHDNFGYSLVAGDFNGDNFYDLAIGAIGEVIGDVLGAGAVNVLYGSSSGLQTSLPADQFWHQNSPSVANTAENNDNFGTALTTSDFDGDGTDDLAISVLEEIAIGGEGAAGVVHVLYGSSSGLQTSSPADQFWSQNTAGVADVSEDGDWFGVYMAAGDLDGDGYSDLAIGVPNEDLDNLVEVGAVHVLYGSSSGLQTTSPADEFWTENTPGVNDSIEEFDRFGIVAAGDFNKDGYQDLAISSSFEDSGSVPDAGAVHILYGSSSGLQTSSPKDQFWTQDSPSINDSAEGSDKFGASLV